MFEPAKDGGSYFMYSCRLSPEKGVATLIEAAVRVGACVKIVGSGPAESALRQIARERNANIEFLGYRSGNVLHDIIRGSGCVSVSSCYVLGT